MQTWSKIAIGLWTTIACAMTSFTVLGQGATFMEHLTIRIEDALASRGFESVTFAFVGDPISSRSVRLDGYRSADPEAVAAVAAVPGVGRVSQMEAWRVEGHRAR